MDRLISIIEENRKDFPEFEYYLPIIGKAKSFEISRPDTSIDCCNALFQGIAKTVILALDEKATLEELDSKNEGKTNKLVKRAFENLKQNDDVYEDDFCRKASAMVDAISFLRNARGDISHGRAVPKKVLSHQSLGTACNEISGSLLSYMLSNYFAIKLSGIAEKDDIEPLIEIDLKYGANPSFNDFLDDENPLPGKMLYSEALFFSYLEDYQIQLDEFRDMESESDYE
jgi:hypothetical protein